MALLKESAHSYYSGTNLGSYQFISLDHIINNFIFGYVGEGKIISKAKRVDVAFYAQRALQEFSYDTLKSIKSQEIELPPSLTVPLPQDYVNYVKFTWSDASGIEHIIYPTSKTSNPNSIAQDSDGNYMFNTSNLDVTGNPTSPNNLIQFPFEFEITEGLTAGQTQVTVSPHILGIDPTTSNYESLADTNPFVEGMEIVSPYFPAGTTISSITEATSTANAFITLSHASTNTVDITDPVKITVLDKNDTWENYKSASPSEVTNEDFDYDDDIYNLNVGQRYGLSPQNAHINGSFYIDEIGGKVHFSSNISGKTIIIKYISDGLGTEEEMVVHKFAEEAMYKNMAYSILSTRLNIPEYLVARLKKERFAETRKAKLRLSNIKLEELTQVLRGKSKIIKH